MRSRTRGVVVILIVAVVGFSAGVALSSCGGDDEASPTTTSTTTQTQVTSPPPEPPLTTTDEQPQGPTVVRVTVRSGVPVGGIVRQTVGEGDRVALVVTSDVADEVHLHGYDLSREVGPGQPARIAFRATIPGRFEVELEERGVPIADLTVRP